MVGKGLTHRSVTAYRSHHDIEIAVFGTGVLIKSSTYDFGVFEIATGVPACKVTGLEAAIGEKVLSEGLRRTNTNQTARATTTSRVLSRMFPPEL